MRHTILSSVTLFTVAVFSAVSFAQAQIRLNVVSASPSAPQQPAAAAANDKSIHITGKSMSNFPWTTTDSGGFQWDIINNGSVSDGSNDVYDGGMQLKVGDTDFPSQPTSLLSADGKEIEITWQYNGLNITRRIFVNTKSGYCRWIDIFENPTDKDSAGISLQYHSNMGDITARTYTTSGKENLTGDDCGIVTAGNKGSSRPAVVHVFSTFSAKSKPEYSFFKNNDNIYCKTSIIVPAGKAVALCFFQAQRKSFDEGVAFLKEFDTASELLLVPPALRKILLNMSETGLTSVDEIDLKRGKKSDMLALVDDSEVFGEITNGRYVIKTDLGQMTIPGEAVIGIKGQSISDRRVFLVMTNGQIIAGELTSGPLEIKRSNGTSAKISPKDILFASYRISPEKPETVIAKDSMMMLRSGMMPAFDATDVDFTFQTSYGTIKPATGDLRAIEMDATDGGLHQLFFRNGSTMAGLMSADKFKLKLKLAPATMTEADQIMEISRQQIKRFVFPGDSIRPTNLTRLTFLNSDEIFGRLSEEKLSVVGKMGPVVVLCSQIDSAEFDRSAAPGQIKMVMRDGSTIAGKLADDYIKFKIEPGPELKIFVGHIDTITVPAEPEPSQPEAETQPASKIRPAATTNLPALQK